uniref:Uncharacterized protein n=1 Tax=Dulem virus 42 TaxID=3145760 RepID=A0AAU8B9P3_9CAUD
MVNPFTRTVGSIPTITTNINMSNKIHNQYG